MELTQEKAEELMEHMMQVAKLNKERNGYKGQFTQVAVVVGPQLQQAVLALEWKDNQEKHIVMKALSLSARSEGALMIGIVSDTRWVLSEKFSEYFHLPDPADIGMDEWQKQYLEIMQGIYGGNMKDLPREVLNEAIFIVVKGPAIQTKTLMETYVEGPNNTIIWKGSTLEESQNMTVNFNLLPDWWSDPTGKPN